MIELLSTPLFQDRMFLGLSFGALGVSMLTIVLMRIRAHRHRKHRFWLLARNNSLLTVCLITGLGGMLGMSLRAIHYSKIHMNDDLLIKGSFIGIIVLILLALGAEVWRSRSRTTM